MQPYIAGFASVPTSLLTVGQIAQLKRMATVYPRAFQEGETREPINGWKEANGILHLPVVRGVQMLRELGFEHAFKNMTSLGHPIEVPRLPDPNHYEASDGQGEFMQRLLVALKTRHAVIGVAGTGNGKTAVALWEVAKLGRTALIVVPGENLAYNWRDEIVKHLGLTEEEIGWVQQDRCDYIGKKIVLAVVHSLCKRTYSPNFYRYFGTVVYDEVHSMAALTFSRVLGKISARYKLAMSATPDRKDGCEGLFLNYFGHDLVESIDDAPLECLAYVVDYALPFAKGEFPESPSIALNILARLKSRNRVIEGWIYRLYHKKRTIVVMSDRIDQLCALMEQMAAMHGIPRSQMCIYAKQKVVKGVRISVGIKELQRLKKDTSIRIYFATYGVFKQGENIPRLDAGIEATPRSDGRQPPGRIRRRRPNKAKPIWVSIRDIGGGWRLTNKSKSRIKEFLKAKIEVRYAKSSPKS